MAEFALGKLDYDADGHQKVSFKQTDETDITNDVKIWFRPITNGYVGPERIGFFDYDEAVTEHNRLVEEYEILLSLYLETLPTNSEQDEKNTTAV